jgi:hypothetical protein
MTSPFANLPRQLVRAFLFLLFWPMFSANGLARPSVVVIDPGHGGHDSGGIPGQRLAEKVYFDHFSGNIPNHDSGFLAHGLYSRHACPK